MLNNFSPNMLKTYEQCKRKFYFQYIENINVPMSFRVFEKGKKVHALANYYLRKINISKIESALSLEEKNLWEALKTNPYYQKECYASEYPILCKVNNYWIGGRIDAVVKDNENYYILDYKTGAIPLNPQYDFQTMVYLLCLDKHLKMYDSLSFVYIDLKHKQNHLIKFTQELSNLYKDKLTDICSKIASESLYAKNKNNCKYCEYQKLCEYKD